MFKPKLDGPGIIREVRRVAHVENVGVRSLDLRDAASAELARRHGAETAALVLSCFYTLSLGGGGAGGGKGGEEPYYTSPLAVPSTSPSWPPVRPDRFAREVPWTCRRLVVRVYGVPPSPREKGGREEERRHDDDASAPPPPPPPPARLLLEHDINMQELAWLRPADSATLPDLPPGSLLLFLPDGVYAPCGSPAALAVEAANLLARGRSGGAPPPQAQRSTAWRMVAPRRANEAATRRARSSRTTVAEQMDGASLVYEASVAAAAAEERLDALGREVGEALGRVPASEEARRLRAWRERLAALEGEVTAEERAARQGREDLRLLRNAHENAANALARAAAQLEAERARGEEELAQRQLAAARARLGGVAERLGARRRRMIYALSQLYPISRMGSSANTMASYTIRGQRLPARDLASIEDEQVSTALGYASHLALLLAKYLEVPLRYTIVYRGSRSSMRDDVQGGAEKPLYTRGESARDFERAHRLLVEDAAQLLLVRCAVSGKAPPRADASVLGILDRLLAIEVPRG